MRNGTATRDANITAPNLKEDCDNGYFISPEHDVLFGEVSITKKGDGDPRSVLLKATAINNYTDDNQIMLWAPGEYAAIQDRQITADIDGDGYADYNNTGILQDSDDMIVNHGYFSFRKNNNNENNDEVMLVTQPTKRALVMAGHGTKYWKKIDIENNEWGQFSLGLTFYDENENGAQKDEEIILVTITSPSNSSQEQEKLYKPELTRLHYTDLVPRIILIQDLLTKREDGY